MLRHEINKTTECGSLDIKEEIQRLLVSSKQTTENTHCQRARIQEMKVGIVCHIKYGYNNMKITMHKNLRRLRITHFVKLAKLVSQ
ncbi:hypothetical protein X777_01525 [Ooceraea biroi]|uniref:Uncharacterized protein n=1 Tax=Ooceraea biroi TaxID=2015173 RepID=A0A026WR78_OOCBI|nr:hypothetical protein X777_01525 [Ooceraea biroi]